MLLLEITLIVVAALVLVPVAVLCVECLAALLPARAGTAVSAPQAPRPRVAVVIPAHNEEAGLPETLATIRPQLRDGDRVVVVADHCDDDTAGVARSAGCEVVERRDEQRRGKGYALDAGLRHVAAEAPAGPPDVVVMVDADCRVEDGAVDRLARAAAGTGRPVQATYLLAPPANEAGSQRQLVSTLAILLKNHVRPRGLARLGCPCLLTGSGMAFPWSVIRDAPLASGNIVEDMQLGLDLAMAGHPAVFCEPARVTSLLPTRTEAAARQRRRWEHGHLRTLIRQAPRLLWSGTAGGRPRSIPLALELAVPPLSLLAATLAGALALAVVVSAVTPVSWAAAWMLAGGAALVLACLLLAWWKFARATVPFSAILSAPGYVLWKAPIYASFVHRGERQWQRTERTPGAGAGASAASASAASASAASASGASGASGASASAASAASASAASAAPGPLSPPPPGGDTPAPRDEPADVAAGA